ncbi:MAG: Imm5 family immunity protein [Aggregatilineales bacterium]
MTIKSQIQQIALTHLSVIQQRPDHEFLPCIRAKFLYDTLAGYPLIRSHLAILTARKVLPIFQKDYSEQKMPARLLRLAERVVAGTLSKESWRIKNYSEVAYHAGGNGWGFFDDIDYQAYSAGHAASTALSEVCGYEYLNNVPATIICDGKTLDHTDYHVIAPKMDTACHAAHAIAYLDDGGLNPEKLLVFWTWWLTDALKEAFNCV